MEPIDPFKNRDRFVQLGVAIALIRKMRGMTQEDLADKANMSRSFLSAIEAPGVSTTFSLEVLFNIADALGVSPADLLNAAAVPDSVIKPKNEK